MRSPKNFGLALLCSLVLVSCAMRTNAVTRTVYDNVFSLVAAGNVYLGEWDPKPDDYVDYMPLFQKYQYTLKHDGTVRYEAIYRRLNSDDWVDLSEEGVYSARSVGPNQTIEIRLADHISTLIWEPNPREPWGSLVFWLCDERDETMIGEKVYLTLLSHSISPHPL